MYVLTFSEFASSAFNVSVLAETLGASNNLVTAVVSADDGLRLGRFYDVTICAVNSAGSSVFETTLSELLHNVLKGRLKWTNYCLDY